MGYVIRCSECSAEIANSRAPVCTAGHRGLEFKYPPVGAGIERAAVMGGAETGSTRGMWRYKDLLPVDPITKVVTLGEGDTPLVHAANLSKRLGMSSLYLKMESLNPTGSFKDRPASLAVTKAIEFGLSSVAIASAGNAAAAASAYAARAGLKCWVFVPVSTPRERLSQILIAGARVIMVEGSVNDCSDLINAAADRFGWYVVTTATPCNAYQSEACRTIAFELWEQLDHKAPNWVVAPVGGGGLLASIARGWQELRDSGLVGALPRLVAVQAAGCAPFVKAYLSGGHVGKIQRWGELKTAILSIADPFPMDGDRLMDAFAIHGGLAIAITDEAAYQAESMLAHDEGIFVEPAASATLAGVQHLLSKDEITSGAVVVLILSGSGFKDIAAAHAITGGITRIRFDIEEMIRTVREIEAGGD